MLPFIRSRIWRSGSRLSITRMSNSVTVTGTLETSTTTSRGVTEWLTLLELWTKFDYSFVRCCDYQHKGGKQLYNKTGYNSDPTLVLFKECERSSHLPLIFSAPAVALLSLGL
jgi:hypothetical protein